MMRNQAHRWRDRGYGNHPVLDMELVPGNLWKDVTDLCREVATVAVPGLCAPICAGRVAAEKVGGNSRLEENMFAAGTTSTSFLFTKCTSVRRA